MSLSRQRVEVKKALLLYILYTYVCSSRIRVDTNSIKQTFITVFSLFSPRGAYSFQDLLRGGLLERVGLN